jgi:uncharacterized Zn-binding protein involved in type VI secretion
MGKPAIRVTDQYINPSMSGAASPIAAPGSTDVFIGNLPAIRMSDALAPIPDTYIPTSVTVLINNVPAAVTGDLTSQSGSLLMGDATVLIGS